MEPTLLDDEAFTNTDTYPLPDGVTQDQVSGRSPVPWTAGRFRTLISTGSGTTMTATSGTRWTPPWGMRRPGLRQNEVTAGLYIVVMEDEDPGDPDPEDPDPENPDPENPDPENSDPENPDPENPDPENPDPEDPGDPGEPDQPISPPKFRKLG